MRPLPGRAALNNKSAAVMGSFCTGQFTEGTHNPVLAGGTGPGATHIAIAMGTTLINQ